MGHEFDDFADVEWAEGDGDSVDGGDDCHDDDDDDAPKFCPMVYIQAGWDGSCTGGSLPRLGVGQEQKEKTWNDCGFESFLSLLFCFFL